MLAACGKTVLISDYFEYYRLAAYLARYTKQKIGITMGAAQPVRTVRREVLRAARRRHPRIVRPVVQERSEAVHLSAAGSPDRRTDDGREPASRTRTAEAVRVPGRARVHRTAGQFQSGIFVDLLARRDRADQSGRPSWSDHVPGEVAEVIRRRGFFGYRKPSSLKEPLSR